MVIRGPDAPSVPPRRTPIIPHFRARPVAVDFDDAAIRFREGFQFLVRDPITERDLRPITAELDWGKQRAMWARLHERLVVGR